MKRNFIYRVWDKKANVYIKGASTARFGISPNGVLFKVKRESDGELSARPVVQERYIIEEFVGFYDILDCKIYEGDIVRVNSQDVSEKWYCENDDDLKLVFWDGESSDEGAYNLCPWGCLDYNDLDLLNDEGEMRVVGNARENPDLLKRIHNIDDLKRGSHEGD